jgi:hypothetical protein
MMRALPLFVLPLSFYRCSAYFDTHYLSSPMTAPVAETQLFNALRHAEALRLMMSPSNPAHWQHYVESLRAVSLANWSASTELQMKFALLRTALNEIR